MCVCVCVCLRKSPFSYIKCLLCPSCPSQCYTVELGSWELYVGKNRRRELIQSARQPAPRGAFQWKSSHFNYKHKTEYIQYVSNIYNTCNYLLRKQDDSMILFDQGRVRLLVFPINNQLQRLDMYQYFMKLSAEVDQGKVVILINMNKANTKFAALFISIQSATI